MNKCKPRSQRVRLHPLKAEEALAAFMRADPAKVEAGMRKLGRKRGKLPALSKV